MNGFGHLHCELAGGHEDQGGRAVTGGRPRSQAVEQRQGEGRGFAGPRRRLREDVASTEEGRNGSDLDGRRLLVAEVREAGEQTIVKVRQCVFEGDGAAATVPQNGVEVSGGARGRVGDSTFTGFGSPLADKLGAAILVYGSDRVVGREIEVDDTDVGAFVHGTTRAINAILTGSTARTAFLATEGHRDILLLREGGRLDPYDNTQPFPRPYVPRALTFEVPGRIGADGGIVTPLDDAAVARIAEELKQQRVEELMLAQQEVAFAKSRSMIGELVEVLIDRAGVPASAGMSSACVARHQGQAPDIDSVVHVSGRELHAGQLVNVRVTDYQAYDLVARAPARKSRSLRVLRA